MKMKIRIYGDSVLSEKALPVKGIDEGVMEFSENLLDAMYKYDGIGLAAPQVGRRSRIIALSVPYPKTEEGAEIQNPLSPGELQLLPRMPLVLINPSIVSFGAARGTREEGCLSVPEIYAPVTRPVSVLVKATVLGGGELTVECGGLLGRALQHEIDHLDGILFVDRLTSEAFEKIRPELEKLKEKSQKKGFFRRLLKK